MQYGFCFCCVLAFFKSLSADQPVADQIPFKLQAGHLVIVEGSLPGLNRPVNLLIDTGATATVVDRGLAKRLGLQILPDLGIKLSAFGSQMKVQRVMVRDLQLGRRLITRSVLAADLPWDNVDVVLGVDILRRGNLAIDYESSDVRFGGESSGASWVPFEEEEGLLIAQVQIDGQSFRLAVDTGAHMTVVYRRSAKSWPIKRDRVPVRMAHSGGYLAIQHIVLSTMVVGGVTINRPRLAILDAEGHPSKIDGFLSPASLGVRRISFDFDRRALGVE